MQGQKKFELVLYMVLWLMLFAAAALSVYADSVSPAPDMPPATAAADASRYDWAELLGTWKLLALFCATFFIHNFFMAPLLVYSNRKWRYAVLSSLLMAAFFGLTVKMSGFRPKPNDMPDDGCMLRQGPPQARPMSTHVQAHGPHGMTHGRIHDEEAAPPPKPARMPQEREPNPMKAKPFGGPTTVAFNIMLLLLGLNVGTKYYFKSLDDRKLMKDLERDNLNQRLQYLKYQINPHFFMNTLNNIHALVDIDPEEAKLMIETLSKLMRYVLYDADKPMASLREELEFLRNYVKLMRVRYTDNVRITVSLPASVPDIQVPSLLFATFVENAFKHGVSCQRESFIDVGMTIDEEAREVCFCCNNSMKPPVEQPAGKSVSPETKGRSGIGLQNAIQRLTLIYGSGYELDTTASAMEYKLRLRIPFR